MLPPPDLGAVGTVPGLCVGSVGVLGRPYLVFTEVSIQGCIADCRWGSRRPVYFADLPGEFIQHLQHKESGSYCLVVLLAGPRLAERIFSLKKEIFLLVSF